MSFLSRFRIVTKIMAIIALMGVVMIGGIWFTSNRILFTDHAYSKFLENDAQAWVLAPRLARNIYQTRYLMLRLIAEPDVEEMRKVEKEITSAFEENAKFTKRLKELTPAEATRIGVLISDAHKLQQLVAPMLKVALAGQKEEAQNILRNQMRPLFDELARNSTALRNDLDKSIQKGSDQLTEETNATVRLVVILMGAGLLLGIGFAIIIAILGIARPIGSLGACMEVLAKGKYDLDVAGLGRKDEVGQMASTVEVFRKNGLEVERIRVEQIEAEKRAVEQRKADMRRLANEFESAVGGIIGTVSSASTELEAAATTLTKTAETTQQ
ncbi:MAG: MCP four helix bundle domain-containing protein, partial [Proteobacteria bacterium]|nr:MCP four helix bundle domain-containing protein [Pseudomonadota bacterium]